MGNRTGLEELDVQLHNRWQASPDEAWHLSGLSLSAARTKAIEVRTALEAGTDPRSTAVTSETFQDVAEEYQLREGSKLRSAKWRKSALERLVYPVIGSRPIADIRRSEIVRLLDQIEDGQGPVQADRTFGVVRRVMSWHASRTDDFNSPIVRGMARTSSKERARKGERKGYQCKV